MSKERDLLPWILGGLSAMTLAAAVAAVSIHKAVVPLPQPAPLVAAALPSLPAAPSPAPAAGSPPPVSNPVAGSELASTPPPPEVQAGQIWECVTKGVKTFSNNPCGEKSQLLEVSSINTMNPTPPIRYARAPTQAQYAPQYAGAYGDAGAPTSQEDYTDQDDADNGADSYTIVQGVAFLPRRRPPQHQHPHRPPYHHGPAQPPRKF